MNDTFQEERAEHDQREWENATEDNGEEEVDYE